MNLICPICASSAFEPTEQKLDLSNILLRWQTEAGITLSKSVWKEYTSPAPILVTLYRCSHCGFEIFDPPATGSESFYTEITATNYYVPDKWEFFEALNDILRLHCQCVLDIGCGSGDFLKILQRYGVESVGYEFSPEVAKLARANGHTVFDGEFPGAILEKMAQKPFDAICMFQVLEHVADPVQLLQSIRPLLNPGGILVIGVPDASGPIRYFQNALTEIPPHHISRWRESVFQAGAHRLGFQVMRTAFEPLPDYLWPFYLPVLWNENIWPAQLSKSIDPDEKMDRADRILWFIDEMKKHGVRYLEGVPGHTLYTVLQFDQAGADTKNISQPRLKEESDFDPSTLRMFSEIRRYMEDWIRTQRRDITFRIESREAALRQREINLDQIQSNLNQRQAELDQRETQYNSRTPVRIYNFLRRIKRRILGKE